MTFAPLGFVFCFTLRQRGAGVKWGSSFHSLGLIMGHHIFSEGKNIVLRVHDSDLALIHHFLKVAALNLNEPDTLSALSEWEWSGPGVWLNVDKTVYRIPDEIFQEALREIENLGTHISASYIERNIADLRGTHSSDIKSSKILGEIQRLQNYVKSCAN
jgi:hypothetical protein